MTKIHRLPDIDQVEREASEWIARLNSDDVSADDRASFETWLTAHAVHARAYEEVSTTWREFTAAGPLVRAVAFGQSINAAVNPRAPRRRWLLAGIAAAALLTLGLSWYRLYRPQETFQTAVGEHATVSLPDGSTLELNSNSLARVEYSDRARVIRLRRGEAFFNVVHDANRPFWVVGGGSWVSAVGTAFNVYLRPSGVRVTVSEGVVRVGEAGRAVTPSDEMLAEVPVSILSAGQQVDLHGAAASIRTLPPAELDHSVAWRSGIVYFEDQPLSNVVAELGRYTMLQIIVDDDKLRRLSVGGTFQANPKGVETLLTMLKDGFGLKIRRETGRIYIERANIN